MNRSAQNNTNAGRSEARACCRCASARLQQGFGLIEVLAAMIILAIGLLALTSLQLSSLKSTNESRISTSVTLLAQEMADRIRANPGAQASYDNISLTDADVGSSATNCGTATSACSPATMVTYDTEQWIADLNAAVGVVRGSINRITAVTPPEFVITVQWDADRIGQRPAASACPAQPAQVAAVDVNGCYRLRFTP